MKTKKPVERVIIRDDRFRRRIFHTKRQGLTAQNDRVAVHVYTSDEYRLSTYIDIDAIGPEGGVAKQWLSFLGKAV